MKNKNKIFSCEGREFVSTSDLLFETSNGNFKVEKGSTVILSKNSSGDPIILRRGYKVENTKKGKKFESIEFHIIVEDASPHIFESLLTDALVEKSEIKKTKKELSIERVSKLLTNENVSSEKLIYFLIKNKSEKISEGKNSVILPVIEKIKNNSFKNRVSSLISIKNEAKISAGVSAACLNGIVFESENQLQSDGYIVNLKQITEDEDEFRDDDIIIDLNPKSDTDNIENNEIEGGTSEEENEEAKEDSLIEFVFTVLKTSLPEKFQIEKNEESRKLIIKLNEDVIGDITFDENDYTINSYSDEFAEVLELISVSTDQFINNYEDDEVEGENNEENPEIEKPVEEEDISSEPAKEFNENELSKEDLIKEVEKLKNQKKEDHYGESKSKLKEKYFKMPINNYTRGGDHSIINLIANGIFRIYGNEEGREYEKLINFLDKYGLAENDMDDLTDDLIELSTDSEKFEKFESELKKLFPHTLDSSYYESKKSKKKLKEDGEANPSVDDNMDILKKSISSDIKGYLENEDSESKEYLDLLALDFIREQGIRSYSQYTDISLNRPRVMIDFLKSCNLQLKSQYENEFKNVQEPEEVEKFQVTESLIDAMIRI